MWGLLTWWSSPARGPGNCTRVRPHVLRPSGAHKPESFLTPPPRQLWHIVSLCKPSVMCLAVRATVVLLDNARQGMEMPRKGPMLLVPCGQGAGSSAGVVRRYAMKTLEKEEMLERNKVMRVLTEEQILQAVDHPFLASLAGTIETPTHLHFLMEFCEGGELYAILTSRPMKRMKESHMRFYCAEVRSNSKRQSS